MIKPKSRKDQARPIVLSLNITMAIAYLVSGLFILFSPSAGRIMPESYLFTVGVALILYSCFRAYRAYVQYSKPKNL